MPFLLYVNHSMTWIVLYLNINKYKCWQAFSFDYINGNRLLFRSAIISSKHEHYRHKAISSSLLMMSQIIKSEYAKNAHFRATMLDAKRLFGKCGSSESGYRLIRNFTQIILRISAQNNTYSMINTLSLN